MQNNRASQSQYTGAGTSSKVPIPRLQRHDFDTNPAASEKHRVIKACTNCRKRSGSFTKSALKLHIKGANLHAEVKCTGELPRCKSCEGSDTPCVYEQARKDRLKTATQANYMLIKLLNELKLSVGDDDKKKIDHALEEVDDDAAAKTSSPNSSKSFAKRARKDSPSDEEAATLHMSAQGEANAPASVGSNEDMDLLDEDLLRSRESRETGFVGQNSEVQWLRSLQRQMGKTEEEPCGQPYGPPGTSQEAMTKRISAMHERRKANKSDKIQHVADSSYYLDGDSLEVDMMVDPYELPPADTAERLFNCYIETAHTWFPVIPEVFKDQFYRYMESVKRQQRYQVPEKWQAALNLVFAIGAQYSHLTDAEWKGDKRDHVVYMTRAVRILGVKDTTMIISAPDLGLIQATGLLSFYYMVIGHVSRAWVMIGISLRFALAVGLHLRNEDPSAPSERKETLVRLWWSLHSVECLLSSITGRPCIIANEDCTVPLPETLPHEKKQGSQSASGRTSRAHHDHNSSGASPSSSGASDSVSRADSSICALPFLSDHVKISLITRRVLKNLYSASTASASWERIQTQISSLIAELDHWAASALPNGSGTPNLGLDFNAQREQVLLSFYYHSIKILITRPCLCRLERKIQGQSDGSDNFNRSMAEACVKAALSMTRMLPDQIDPVSLYRKGPWWSITHNIMQAMAVFLLEMFYRGTHMSKHGNNEIPKNIKKLLRWLRVMRTENPVADRAYKLVINILKSGESQVQEDITDLLAEDEANIDRGNLFARYAGEMAPPSSMPLSNTGEANVFAAGDWQSNYWTGDQFDNGMPDPFFLPEQFQMPLTFGNPFATNFDQGNPISMGIGLDEMWSRSGAGTGDAAEEFSPLDSRGGFSGT